MVRQPSGIPPRALPMKTAFLIAFGLALVGTGAWAMSDTHAAALSARPATMPAATAAHAADGAILPYGAMGHRGDTAGAAVLPYGAMSSSSATTREAILPYGVLHAAAATPSEAILPYGAMGPHAAP
jgi:hypothetical protein